MDANAVRVHRAATQCRLFFAICLLLAHSLNLTKRTSLNFDYLLEGTRRANLINRMKSIFTVKRKRALLNVDKRFGAFDTLLVAADAVCRRAIY